MSVIDDVISMWQKDSVIDRTEPGRELINIPKLHAKYLQILSNHRMFSKNCEFNITKMRRLKWEYYTGKMDKETLERHGWPPFQYTLKSELSTYIDSDEDINRLQAKKQIHDEVVEICTSIMKELNSRTWEIRSFIDWEKFVGGN